MKSSASEPGLRRSFMSLTMQNRCREVWDEAGRENGVARTLLVLQPCPQLGKSALGTRLARSSR